MTPRAPSKAARVAGIAFAVAVAGCVRRADFVPLPPPAPIAPPRATAPAAAPDGPLSAADAVRLALSRSPDVRAAAARIAQAQAAVMAARAGYLPHLFAEVTYLQGDTPSAFLFKRIDARRLPPNTDFNDPGEFSSLGGTLALRWNVWNGSRDLLGAWAADAGAAMAGATADAVRNALVAAVAGTWLDARAAAAGLAADDASIRALDAAAASTRVQVDGGSALRTDLLSLEVRLSEARAVRLHTQTSERLALAALRELLAIPPDAPVAVSSTGPVIDALPADATTAIARAYELRPEARAARHAVEQAGLELAAARRAWLPRLDVESRLGAEDAEARFSPVDRNWTFGVALSMSLFDGGVRRANVQRALAAVDLVAEADRSTLLRIAREVETAYLHLDEARAQLDVVTRALVMADETLGLVTTQYRGGAATVTRFLEAEGALARARAMHVDRTIGVARAELDAARAIGALASGALAEGRT